MPADSRPDPAATVLVLRESPSGPEVFMVRRHEAHAAFSGAHVFPGGCVDTTDRGAADAHWCDGVEHAARQLADLAPADAVAYHVAAARELFEEAGVLLARDGSGRFVSLASLADHARFKDYRLDVHAGRRTLRQVVEGEGLRLALGALVVYAHWVTPPIDRRRFDTWFFVTRMPPDQTPAHDEVESTHGAWVAAVDALRSNQHREIILPPPTWTTLCEIARFGSVDQILEWTGSRRIQEREPKLRQQDGAKVLVVPGDLQDTTFVWSDGCWRPAGTDAEQRSWGT